MAGNWIQRAVDALADRYESELPGELAIVETEEGLGAGDLTAPKEYLRYRSIFDTRSPLLQIYELGFEAGKQRNKTIWVVACQLVFSYAGDADLLSNETFMRRYVTALMRVVVKDTTLGGAVVQVAHAGADALRVEGDRSESFYRYGIAWDVAIQEIEG